MIVGLWRVMGDLGVTTVPGFRDPVARYMMDGPVWNFFLGRAAALAGKPADSRARRNVAPHFDMMVLRFAFIDAQLAAHPAQQVVILGAGLDTRAFRLQALRGKRVFEVDHPDTQAYKRERVGRLGPPLADLRFAAVDFTRDDLGSALAAAGFDASVPTTWVWEGVIMYLDDAAMRGTLRELRRLSAAGSTLIAHYHEPAVNQPRAVGLLRRLVLSSLGEPQIGLRSQSTMQDELTSAGWSVLEDAGLPEQAARVGAHAPDKAEVQISRVAVASA
jgi:methyltransferase (TIGR00027 family)